MILNNELLLRKIYASAFIGNKYQCPVCEKKTRKFIPVFENDLMCPHCGSLSRNRRLYHVLLKEFFLKDNLNVLDFSPSRCLYRKFKGITSIQYTANDFCGEFMADKHMDITNMNEPDNSFDLIICYHILEHIKNDIQAMSELFRVLKPGGTAIIQTPFKENDIYENNQITSREEQKIHFGQEDHLRIYSVKGLCQRLEQVYFKTEVRTYKDESQNYFGFSNNEHILFCKK